MIGIYKRFTCSLSNSPALVHPKFDREFPLQTDASDIGLGAILLQRDDNGVERPIAYLVITNVQQFYKKPLILAPVGTSDHNVVNWRSDDSASSPHGKVIKRQRRFFLSLSEQLLADG